nr:Protein GLB-12 [Haemonchus contortus]
MHGKDHLQTAPDPLKNSVQQRQQKLDDPKDIVGLIFVDIVNDIAPELKKVFGVERAPKAGMLKMPKFGGHVARFTELIEQTTTMLGFTENLSGAWQLVRKTGRIHVKQSFLEQNQNQLEKNYFDVVLTTFIECFIPYLTGEKVIPVEEGSEKKKVRFAQTYTPSQITDVWKRLFSLISAQMTDSFELERTKQRNAQSQKTLAPHQHVEESERKKKRIQEKQSEIENTASSHEPKAQEQMFEDPF